MGLESTTYLSGLTESWPLAGDLKSQGDDHLRLVKLALKNSFPEASRPFYYPKFSSKIANFSPNNTTDDNTIYLVDTTAGNVVVTLPAMPANPWQIRVIKTSADANVVSFVGTVSGGTLPTLKSEDESYHIGSNGTAYFDLTGVIRNGSITTAKFANMNASRLLGNATGAPTIPGEISLDPLTLEFNGTALRVLSTLVAELRTQSSGFFGFGMSTAGSSATVGIAAGATNDIAFGGWMKQPAAYTKTTSAWAVGTGNGALDASSIAPDTTYHWFVIKRPDTGVVDYLCSLSATAPTMPTNYTLKRRIGSIRTNSSSQWATFTQLGDVFTLAVPGQVAPSIGTARGNITLAEIPLGISVEAYIRLTTSSGANPTVIITSLLENDIAPSGTNGYDISQQVSGVNQGVNIARITDTSARVAGRSSIAATGCRLTTFGWRDVTLHAG